MRRMGGLMRAWVAREDGATAVEYALIAGAVSAAIVAIVFALGVDVAGLLQSVLDNWPT